MSERNVGNEFVLFFSRNYVRERERGRGQCGGERRKEKEKMWEMRSLSIMREKEREWNVGNETERERNGVKYD